MEWQLRKEVRQSDARERAGGNGQGGGRTGAGGDGQDGPGAEPEEYDTCENHEGEGRVDEVRAIGARGPEIPAAASGRPCGVAGSPQSSHFTAPVRSS